MVDGMQPRAPEPDLPQAEARLRDAVDGVLERAARLAGDLLACRQGCTECCLGPFPISSLDAWRLRRGLAELEAREPGRAAALVRRVAEARTHVARDYPGDLDTGGLAEDEEARDRFFAAHESLPCPVLDPDSGACELYAHRPMSCRTYGPPVRIGGRDLPPCRLCFVGASAAAVAACRVEPDPEDREGALLAALEARSGGPTETIVAFALEGGVERPKETRGAPAQPTRPSGSGGGGR